MDADFEILLPAESNIKGLPFEVPYFEWDGIKYPQGPPECKFGSNFELKVLDRYDFDYIESKVPSSLRNISWQAISVQGNGLDIYAGQLAGFSHEQKDYSLKDLLITLLSSEPIWLVAFSPQSDGFDRVYAGNVESILKSLENYLKEIPEAGFMIYNKSILSPAVSNLPLP